MWLLARLDAKFLRLSLQTWLFLGLYLLFVVYHLCFVQAPGEPELSLEQQMNVQAGSDSQLIALSVLPPDGSRAIAGVRRPDGKGSLWLLDWTRASKILSQNGQLNTIKIAETPSARMPKRAFFDAQANTVYYLTQNPSGVQKRWSWKLGGTSTSRVLPNDYLFTTSEGRDISVKQAEELLARDIPSAIRPKIMPGTVIESENLVITRIQGYGTPAKARNDDFYVFDRSTGKAREIRDTTRIFEIFTPPHFSGILYTDGTASWITGYDCDSDECADWWPHITTGGAKVKSLDYLPESQVLSLCISKGSSHSLMLYENPQMELETSPESGTYLGSLPLESDCTFHSLVDSRTIIVRSAKVWKVIAFATTEGGLIR